MNQLGFRTVEEDITPLLANRPQTRCNDMKLYELYITHVKKCNLSLVFNDEEYRVKHAIAPYETVSRCRRRLQKLYPELQPTARQKERKKELEHEYRLYAKGVR